MEIKDMIDFHALILSSGIGYHESMPNLKAFGDCLQHYSTMCDCEGDAKQNKKTECQLRYEDIIQNKMSEISERLLEYNPSYIFKSNDKIMRAISK